MNIEFNNYNEYGSGHSGGWYSGEIGIYRYFYCTNRKRAWVRMPDINQDLWKYSDATSIGLDEYGVYTIEAAKCRILDMIIELQNGIDKKLFFPIDEITEKK